MHRSFLNVCWLIVVLAVPTRAEAADSEHWAFQPVVDHPLPAVQAADLVQTPIDCFIFSRLEQQGLAPAPKADKRTLLRRVAYDLVGLPPTSAEIEDFLTDESPDAYAKVVERLLASPHYGERWGRYWLDVARYADTKGYIYDGREDRRFFHSHVYRDWVIQAINEDLPYDQFLIQQIAGDQIAAAGDRRPLAAMGFVTVGRRFAGNFYEIIDDRIDAVCRTTMALTVSCARCHDHKFDPISAADYYSLYAVFAGSYDTMAPLAAAPSPEGENAAFWEELRRRQSAYDDLLAAKSQEVVARVRARTADYLSAVLDVESLPTEHEYRFLDAADLNPVFVRQWHSFLIRERTALDPIFEPWIAMAEVPENEFAVRFTDWLAVHGARLNPRVTEALAGTPPQSMRDLAQALRRLLDRVNQDWLSANEAAKTAQTSPPAGLLNEADEALRQDASTALQIFSVADVIEFISGISTLEPGDIISTGTPAGVGNTTGTYIKAGDTLVARIDKIGALISPVAAE